MARSRKSQISLDATSYYHCISRCVRRAFLCGFDPLTQISYEHRRQWVEDRLLWLGEIFAIDICAYAVMTNHVHVVLHVNLRQGAQWSIEEVITRWHRLYKGVPLSHRYLNGDRLSPAEQKILVLQAEQWRETLTSISRFMAVLNEGIARRANQEDQCTGRFWEGRFKSQALLDEKALIACMAYVDLNPIRVNIAPTPESSDHTSIHRRIQSIQNNSQQPSELMPFVTHIKQKMPEEGLPFLLKDYLELMDWTGRAMREDKLGYIDNQQPPILARLDISEAQWHRLTQRFEKQFKCFAGQKSSFERIKDCFSLNRMPPNLLAG
ncbi:transposase [Gynuella sp.]|uniref:transposase n=1 Tax=Gynuella sp. TaxID=2969146 RepID=UPI003D12018A